MRAFFDHTGDIGVTLTAPSLPALFDEAARAFTATLLGDAPVAAAAARAVAVTGPTLDDLMVDWLGDILYLFEVQNLLVSHAEVQITGADGGWRLEATVHGDTFDPDRHMLQVLVKGITYHRLAVRDTADGWTTDIVFDI